MVRLTPQPKLSRLQNRGVFMYINGVNIPYNVANVDDNKKFSFAFQEVSYKARVNENKFKKGELSEKELKKKQVKIIQKFFKCVSNEDTAEQLFKTCKNYDDYVRAFGECAKKISTASILLNAVKSKARINRKQKRIKKSTKKSKR